MEDNQTTVTMSLARFKELESFEKAAIALTETKRFLFYYGYPTIYLEGDEITQQLLGDVIRMEERVNRIREAIRIKFPKAYEQLNNEIWL